MIKLMNKNKIASKFIKLILKVKEAASIVLKFLLTNLKNIIMH